MGFETAQQVALPPLALRSFSLGSPHGGLRRLDCLVVTMYY
jgi:hypothetical protein